MKKIWTLALIVISSFSHALGAGPLRVVADPLADFSEQHKNDLRNEDARDERIVRLEVDLDNDGRQDVLLSAEKTGQEDGEYENRVYTWDVYRKLGDGSFAAMELQKFETPDGPQLLQGRIEFDPDMFYVGFVKEANAYGLVATLYLPKHNGVELSTYVLRGDYFEQLNFPEPKNPAKIYHRNETNDVPDLPETARTYLAKPSLKMVTVSRPATTAPSAPKHETTTKAGSVPAAAKSTAPEAKPASLTPGEEPASSTRWSVIAVLIVVGSGVLLLVLKKRK